MLCGYRKGIFDMKSVENKFSIKYLHAGHYDTAANIECFSCERFWNKEKIKALMRKREIHGRMISYKKDCPVGYMIYKSELARQRLVLLNLVILPEYRRVGLGTMLINSLTSLFFRKNNKHHIPRYNRLLTCVRESNTGAHYFLNQSGLNAIAVKRNCFQDRYPTSIEIEDGYIFKIKRNRK